MLTRLSFIISFLAAFQCLAVEITKVPSSSSTADAHLLREARLNLFIEKNLSLPIQKITDQGFFERILARILSGRELQEVNDSILHPSTKPTGLVGTDFPGVLGLCARKGDYDFKLTELIPVVYEGIKRGSLSEKAYNKILSQLLTVTGNKHQLKVRMGKCIWVPETENHILMIESARYLTNQLWHKQYPDDPRFDNEKNGFNAWLLRHMQQFLKKDFEEYNSRPYQGHSIKPLLNLISYAEDSRVRMGATLVLDYLGAKFAVQSSRLRRSAPICRQEKYSKRTNLLSGDHLTAIYAMLAGNTDIYKYGTSPGIMGYGVESAMHAGVSKYRPDDLILDMIIHNDQILEQRIRHDAVESYYKHPKFLITAGGRYLNRFDGGMKKRDGWAYPTSVMPTKGTERDRTELLRFEGAYKQAKRNNMCQYKNFACGMNLKIPSVPAGCLIDKGEWKFLNYQSPQCPLKYGYYVAIHVKRYPAPGLFRKRVASNFGTFEVVDASDVNFEDFMEVTMKNNQGNFHHKQGNVYHAFDGSSIEFHPGSTNLKISPITKVNGASPFPLKFSSWPFLRGNLLSSKGDGKIIVKNPKLERTLILDYSNPLNPGKNEF